MPLSRLVSTLAWLTLLYVLMMFVWTRFLDERPQAKVDGFKPVLAIEFAESDTDVAKIVDGPEVRRRLRDVLGLDYGFIVLHFLLLLSLCLVLWRSGSQAMRGVAAVAATGTLALAASNIVQNLRLARVIDEARLIADVDMPGYLKWFLTFAVIGLLSFVFFRSGGWVKALGALCLLIFVAGVAGLAGICFKFGPRSLRLIELAFVLIGILLILVAVVFTFYPHRVAGLGAEAPG